MAGAESCIPTQNLARAVEERLARRVFVSAAQADVSVEGHIEKKAKPSGWHAVITIRDAKGALLGTRELDRQDASCDSMNEPLALVIAVMIDPDAAMKPQPAPPVPAPPPPAPPLPPPDPVAPLPPSNPEGQYPGGITKREKDPWRAEGAAVFAMSAGLTPQLAPGFGVEGVLFIPNTIIGLRAYGNIFLPTTAERDGARASFDLMYVGSAICPTLRKKSFVGMICIGGQLGILRSSAETVGRAIEETSSFVWNGATEVRVTIPVIAPLEVTAGLGAVLPLLRPAVGYAPAASATGAPTENLHKVDVFGFTGSVGAGFFFP